MPCLYSIQLQAPLSSDVSLMSRQRSQHAITTNYQYGVTNQGRGKNGSFKPDRRPLYHSKGLGGVFWVFWVFWVSWVSWVLSSISALGIVLYRTELDSVGRESGESGERKIK
ncbi:hypothetical protein ASPZODRAFT_722785 [Penicilliopsis zonata CBS 506.65]|uniref:Uncharacterized protein n=1 Tax=Penicilliopsis zonata CBS 506.65 TaxID=1073090 RepID=A0A1L9SC45_9EURO|nr:hypothetical protein ASPZODRAFT_722785 [Penicilliopsis zonata CBS 506.65]OJJ44712.1 hypothetical protein ASPZODRAFT_722785 [Penicilliopsis zonata CBS 506.65]